MTAWWRRDGRSAGPARLAYECGYDMAGTVVLVDAPGHVQDYLGRFFAPAATADDQVAAGLVVRVRPDSAGTVRIGYSSAGRWSGSLVVPAVEEGVTVRKLVRAWGLSGPDAALRGILHAAAFVAEDRTFAVLGPPRTGKTTLLLDAVLNRLLVGLSNDAMAIDHHDGLWLANVPSVIGVRPDTVTLFAGPLRDLARHRVPTIGVADDGSHYYYPDRFLTARASARPMPGALPPVVAVGRFARPGEPARVRPIGPSRVCAMTIAELAAWPLGREVDGLAARLGGVSWRVVTARSIAVLDRLLTGATVVEFVHTGSVAPLLEFARSRQEETCR